MFKKRLTCFLIAAGIFNYVQAQSVFRWPEITRVNKPWAIWRWMGNAVDPAGLQYNLETLQKAGIGGVEVVPIYGVKGLENKAIDFLSPEWMKMLHVTIEEADNLDMGVVLSTGTGWPFGGPRTGLPEAASKVIFRTYSLKQGETLSSPVRVEQARQRQAASLQLLMAYSDQEEQVDLTGKIGANGKLDWTAPEGNWQLIAVFNGKTFQRVKRAGPGGDGWVADPFSDKVLQEYLQPFTDAFKENSCPVPEAFFDDSYEIAGADWTENFLQEFAQRRGYRLEDHLPALLDREDPALSSGRKDTTARLIADYRQTLADLLLDHFARKWTGWARDIGSRTQYQAHGSPGNLLDLYGAADIPEIETYGPFRFDIPGLPADSLGKQPGVLDPLLLKFASSAAHVSGKKLTSSETFTWLGEHFRVALSQCKPELDALFVSGINHAFFHSATYTPKGAPWPGWLYYASVNFSPYNPFWQAIPAFNQYIGRVQSFLQKGEPDNDVLLYWPVQDVWALHTDRILYRLTVDNIDEWLSPTPFHAVGGQLMRGGYGFDYISDNQLLKTEAADGLLKTPGASYKALVIPPCKYMPLTTLQKILALAEAGATVIFAGSLPEDVPGLDHLAERRKKFRQLKTILSAEQPYSNINQQRVGRGAVFAGNDLINMMQRAGVEAAGFAAAGLSFIRREDEDGYIYFVSNLHHHTVEGWIPLAKHISSAVFYDPYSGKAGRAAVKKTSGKDQLVRAQIYLRLAPGQSMIVKAWSHEQVKGPLWQYVEPAGPARALDGPWVVAFEQGMPAIDRSYTLNKLKSWTTLSDSAKVFAGSAKYTLSFDLPAQSADDWLLRLGEVDFSAEIKVNGHEVGNLWAVPFETRIGPYLKPGKNTLEVAVTNLGANRIADYDRKGIYWKKFDNINIVNMAYRPFDASSWKPVSSGLLGPVTLMPLRTINPEGK